MTYIEMCQVIADDWNREQDLKGVNQIYLTAEDIWGFDLVSKFPALYIPMMYDAAKEEQLIGLLLSDNTCAGMFMRHLGKNNEVQS